MNTTKLIGSICTRILLHVCRGHPFLDPGISGVQASPVVQRKQAQQARLKTPGDKRRERRVHPTPKIVGATPTSAHGGGSRTIKKSKKKVTKKARLRTAVGNSEPPVKQKRRPHPFLDSDSPYKDQSPHLMRRGKSSRTTSQVSSPCTLLQAIDNERPGDAWSEAFEKALTDLLSKDPKWLEKDTGSAERDATIVTAISSGKVGAAVLLLDHGATVTSVRKSDGRGLLHLLLEHDHVDVDALDALVESGVAIDAKDSNGTTALHVACSRRSEDANEILRILLNHHADKDIKDGDGKLPEEYSSAEMIAYFVRTANPVSRQSRMKPTASPPSDDTAIDAATSRSSSGALSSKSRQVCRQDVTNSANSNKKGLADRCHTKLHVGMPAESVHSALEISAGFDDTSESGAVLDASTLARQKRRAKRTSLEVSACSGPIRRSSSQTWLHERSAAAYSPRDAELNQLVAAVEDGVDVFAMKPPPNNDGFTGTVQVDMQERRDLKERLQHQRFQREKEKAAADAGIHLQKTAALKVQRAADAAAARAAAEVELLRHQLEAANAEAVRAHQMRETLEREQAAVETIRSSVVGAENRKTQWKKDAREQAAITIPDALAERADFAEEERTVEEKVLAQSRHSGEAREKKAQQIIKADEQRERQEVDEAKQARATDTQAPKLAEEESTWQTEERNVALAETVFQAAERFKLEQGVAVGACSDGLSKGESAAEAEGNLSSEPEDAPPPPPPPLDDSPPHSPRSLPATANNRVDFYSNESGSEDQDGSGNLDTSLNRQVRAAAAVEQAKMRGRVARARALVQQEKDFYSTSEESDQEVELDEEKRKAREAALLRVKNRRAGISK